MLSLASMVFLVALPRPKSTHAYPYILILRTHPGSCPVYPEKVHSSCLRSRIRKFTQAVLVIFSTKVVDSPLILIIGAVLLMWDLSMGSFVPPQTGCYQQTPEQSCPPRWSLVRFWRASTVRHSFVFSILNASWKAEDDVVVSKP